jgi:hypothetical protein
MLTEQRGTWQNFADTMNHLLTSATGNGETK